MKLPCGYATWSPGAVVPSVPYTPEDDEPVRNPVTAGDVVEVAPTQPGAAGEQWLVAIGRFPDGPIRGVLWNARIESAPVNERRLGPNRITVSAPTDPVTMRLIGDAIPGALTPAGGGVYHVKEAVAFELILGSTIDGNARRRFVVRDAVQIRDGRISMTGVGIIGGLTADRVIGAPTRRNLVDDGDPGRGSFEKGTLAGWRAVGDASAGVVAGGIDGSYCAWVTGTPGSGWLETQVTYSQPERPWGRQRIAGQAYVKLPKGLDIEDYGLVTIKVVNQGTVVWPDARRGDPDAGVVTSDMARGTWIQDPVVGIGYLPTPPFSCQVILQLHPVDETERVYFDGAGIIRRENTSTVYPRDLVGHPRRLFEHAQIGRDKSDWGVGVVEGAGTGIVKVGTWWHPDGQSMDEALEALCGQGMEVYDLAGPGRRVKAANRRGRDRLDVAIMPWHVLASVSWQVDPGAQRTAIRAVSAAGSIWGGADEGAFDTSQANGQVIDVVLSGPVGMTPSELQRWVNDQVATLSLLPATATIMVPWRLGTRLAVGDALRVALRDGSAGHTDWMRVTQWVPELGRRFVALGLGTDPSKGGL